MEINSREIFPTEAKKKSCFRPFSTPTICIRHVTQAVCTYKNSHRAAAARLKRIEVSEVRFRGVKRGILAAEKRKWRKRGRTLAEAFIPLRITLVSLTPLGMKRLSASLVFLLVVLEMHIA